MNRPSLYGLSAQAAGLHPEVWASYVLENRPCIIDNHYMIPATGAITLDGGRVVEGILLAADFGNDAFKLVVRSRTTQALTCLHVPATYQPAATISYGVQVESWQERQAPELAPLSEEFCIGEEAAHGDSLPVGPTDQRLNEPRSARFLKACLVKALSAAGYAPGHYSLSMSLGLRNEEIAEKSILPQTREAMQQLKRPFAMLHRDSGGRVEEWTITIGEIFPYPQTFGTFFALDTNLSGRSVLTNYLSFVIVDLGGYDSHAMEVERRGRGVSAVGRRFVDGTIAVARALATELKKPEHYPLLGELSEQQGQQVLITGQVLYGGQWLDVSPLVRQIKESRGGHLLSTMLSRYQKASSYFVFTGGGSILLADEIRQRMADMQRSRDMYMILDPAIAPVANCIGLYGLLNIRKRPR